MMSLSQMPGNEYTVVLKDMFLPLETNLNDMSTVKGVYLIMDYIPYNLYDVLYKRKELLTREEAILLSYNLLCATKFMHSSNILHRDIKPGNILVNEDFEVKICDFGFSRGITVPKCENKLRRRKLSHSCFTRYYRPPEVIIHMEEYNH